MGFVTIKLGVKWQELGSVGILFLPVQSFING